MSFDLIVEDNLSGTPQIVSDDNMNVSPLVLTNESVSIGTGSDGTTGNSILTVQSTGSAAIASIRPEDNSGRRRHWSGYAGGKLIFEFDTKDGVFRLNVNGTPRIMIDQEGNMSLAAGNSLKFTNLQTLDSPAAEITDLVINPSTGQVGYQ